MAIRSVKIQVMMKPEEASKLDYLAEKAGLSRSAYIRALILSQETAARNGGDKGGETTTTPLSDH